MTKEERSAWIVNATAETDQLANEHRMQIAASETQSQAIQQAIDNYINVICAPLRALADDIRKEMV